MFAAIVEQGGLSGAARACEMSPTMVAKHLHSLEEPLGVRLFNRTTRRQSLTEAGQTYYEYAKRLLETWNEVDASVSSLRTEPRGTLRLFAPVTFGAHGLPPLLAAFQSRYPDVILDVTLSDRHVDIIAGGFDAAFAVGVEDSEYVARDLPPYTMAVGASPEYLQRRGCPEHPSELEGHDCLAYAYFDHPETWRFFGPDGEERVSVKNKLRINNGEALLHAAEAGMGIVMQPEILLLAAFRAGTLIRLFPDYQAPARRKSLLYLPDRRMSLKLRCFIDFTVEFFMSSRPS